MFFKALAEARGVGGELNAANIGCGGGKFYTALHRCAFVRLRVAEGALQADTEMVLEFIGRLGVPEASGAWLNFARIDTPQARRLSVRPTGRCFSPRRHIVGMVSWAVYDNNATMPCACLRVGMQCVVTQAVRENRGADAASSWRCSTFGASWVDARSWGSSRDVALREMCGTMRASCLFGTMRGTRSGRINGGNI